MSLVVLGPGLLSTLQDNGRRGSAALGIGSAGAMDPVAMRLANALVGNADDDAVLEITLLGPRLRFDANARIALVGAEFDATLDDRPFPLWRPQAIRAGSILDCGRARLGACAYLAIAGGITAERVLGSASSDVNSGLGPFGGRPLAIGDTLPFPARAQTESSTWSLDPRPWFDRHPTQEIRMIRGAHFDALDNASKRALFGSEFRIAAGSNRVGFRLGGPKLALAAPLELVSAPITSGSLQLPAGGTPIALMAEHPTTGGYPLIGQIAAIDLPRLAQRRPGDPVRFAPIDLDDAQTRYLARERELTRLIARIAQRLAH